MTDEERPDRPSDGAAGDVGGAGGGPAGADEDAVWAALVESFHRSPSLPDTGDDLGDDLGDGLGDEPGAATHDDPAPRPAAVREPEEHFVPPPPAPGPPLEPAARFAWLGTIGGPAFLLIVAVVGWDAPQWLIWLAVAGFLAGFVTLVARMRREDDPHDGDDGAVV